MVGGGQNPDGGFASRLWVILTQPSMQFYPSIVLCFGITPGKWGFPQNSSSFALIFYRGMHFFLQNSHRCDPESVGIRECLNDLEGG